MPEEIRDWRKKYGACRAWVEDSFPKIMDYNIMLEKFYEEIIIPDCESMGISIFENVIHYFPYGASIEEKNNVENALKGH